MPAPKVRGQYAELNQIAQTFSRQAEKLDGTLQRVKQAKSTLQGGEWLGQGATAFYAEMDGQVLPALQRLVKAFQGAQHVTGQIRQVLEQAEKDAAACFHLDASGATAPAAGAGGGSTAADPSPTMPAREPPDPTGKNPVTEIFETLAQHQATLADINLRLETATGMERIGLVALQKLAEAQVAVTAQQAIDAAIEFYDIDIHGATIIYDPSIGGAYAIFDQATNTIRMGPTAFDPSATTSTNEFASAIAHEGIHAQQLAEGRLYFGVDADGNSYAIDPQGAAMNELEAWKWEQAHATENGLSAAEITEIDNQVAHYYNRLTPENQALADADTYVIPGITPYTPPATPDAP